MSDLAPMVQGAALPSLSTGMAASLPEILLLAWDIGDEHCRFELIRKLIIRLPDRILKELDTTARLIKNDRRRLLAIARLASLKPDRETLVEARGILDAARAIKSDAERALELAAPGTPAPWEGTRNGCIRKR